MKEQKMVDDDWEDEPRAPMAGRVQPVKVEKPPLTPKLIAQLDAVQQAAELGRVLAQDEQQKEAFEAFEAVLKAIGEVHI